MRIEKRGFNLLYLIAIVLMLAVLPFTLWAFSYSGFSHTPQASVAVTDATAYSFHCAGITYSGDYANAPSKQYGSIKYKGVEVSAVPTGLDIKLQDGGLVKYTVIDSTNTVLGSITTSDNVNLVISSEEILNSTDILILNVEFSFNTYTVNYELYEGTLYDSASTMASNGNPQYINFSNPPTLVAPSLAGYNFVRWYMVVGDAEVTVEEFSYGIFDENNSVTLYAAWTPASYLLTLYKDDTLSEKVNDWYVQFGTPLSSELPNGDGLECEAGYRFSGWYNATTNAKVSEDAIMPASAYDLYAKYELIPAEVQISFDYEQGDNSVEHRSLVENLNITPDTYTFGRLTDIMGVTLGIDGHTYEISDEDGKIVNTSEDLLNVVGGKLYKFTVNYKRLSYTVTINYKYEDSYNDDSTVAPSVVRTVLYGDSVTVKSPKIDNFAPYNLEWTESRISTDRTKTIKYYSTEKIKSVELSDGTVITITNGEGGLAGATIVVESRGSDKLKSLTSSLQETGFLTQALGDYWIGIEGAKFGLLGSYKINIRAAVDSGKVSNPALYFKSEDSLYPYDAQFGEGAVEFTVSAARLKDGIEAVYSGLVVSNLIMYVIIGVVGGVLLLAVILLVLWLTLWRKMKLSFEVNGGDAIAPIKTKRNTTLPVPKPFREKAIFLGWFTDKKLTVPAVYEEDEIVHAELDDMPYNSEATDFSEFDDVEDDMNDLKDRPAKVDIGGSKDPVVADVEGKSIMMKKSIKLYASWYVEGQPDDMAEEKDKKSENISEDSANKSDIEDISSDIVVDPAPTQSEDTEPYEQDVTTADDTEEKGDTSVD